MSQPYSGFDPQFDIGPKPGMHPAAQAQAQAPAPASGLAITSLVTGILGWTALPLIGSLIAVVTGHMALGQVRSDPYRYGGKGLATAGLVLGYIALALAVLATIIAVAVAMLFVTAVRQIDFDQLQVASDESVPVAERVVAIVADQTKRSADAITPEMTLADDLQRDELDMVELVMAVEEAFSITLDDAEVEKLRTVQDLIDLVERKKGSGLTTDPPVNGLPAPPTEPDPTPTPTSEPEPRSSAR